MAEVFLVKRRGPEGFQKRLVIKRLLPHLNRSQSYIDLFLEEARMAALVDHPNLAHVSDFGQVEGRHYLAMEYVDGVTVSLFLDRLERVPLGVAVRIAIDVLAGLEALHTARGIKGEKLNLVHRDITPRNVMVARGGHVKLIDLGIAVQAMAEDTKHAGTKNHMSPEQAEGRPVDKRSDVYSVGLLLIRMLCGRVEIEHAKPHPKRPSSIDDDRLWEILQTALAHEPEGRFESAYEFSRALERYAVEIGEEASRSFMSDRLDEIIPSLTQTMRLEMVDDDPLAGGPVTQTASVASDVPLEPAADTAKDVAPLPTSRADTKLIEAEPPVSVFETTVPTSGTQTNPIDGTPDSFAAEETVSTDGGGRGRWLVAVAALGLLVVGGLYAAGDGADVEPAAAPSPAAEVVETAEVPDEPEPSDEPVVDAPRKKRPKRRARRAKKRRAKKAKVEERFVGPGFLTINTKPWTRVSIDGKPIDVTPIERAKVPSGRHELRMRNEAEGVDKKIKITVEPGRELKISRTF